MGSNSVYACRGYLGKVISYAAWLYFRFLLSLNMMNEMLDARGIEVGRETAQQWALNFGQSIAN